MRKLLITLALVLLPWTVKAGSIERLPTAAGNYSELTPSAGANWENVNEAVCDDATTANLATNDGERDTYTYPVAGGDAVPADSTVDSLVVTICCEHGGLPFVRDSIRALIRYDGGGAADYEGGTLHVVTNAFADYSQTWAANPKTSSAWAASEANDNDYEIGVICTDAGDQTSVSRVSATWYYSSPVASTSTPQVIMVN